MTTEQIISIVIFLITMTAIMTERVHRTVAAITGAILLIVTHILTIETSISYVDMNTIGVLVGMMLFVAVVKNSGIFEYIAIKSAKIAKGKPVNIMIIFILITTILSAFLDNVTTVLLIGPMTIAITRILKINPVPFLITQIMASNIGGTATLIGDPPNIMIGSAANLGFTDFILNTGIPVIFIIITAIIYFLILYKKQLAVDEENILKVMEMDENKAIKDKSLMIKSIILIVLVVIGFVFHSNLQMESCVIALLAAIIMLLIGKQDAEEIILGVEWSTILFFIGLFIVVGGLEETGVIDKLANLLVSATSGNMILTMIIILWASAIISSFLDNIPFVATLIPLILTMQQTGNIDVTPLWWALSLGACLGGNGTLIGASANVVLSSISNKNGYPITFKHYFKIGFPLMIISIIISSIYLLIRF
ncbi:ArsB/NhaD family transporter [Anaerofustis sp. NSJ-163]|uniref:ArsB/NhaD family transporter n=1 Tax=Anaerofustis sp. NSJ-163 TaxID=2944391 RepID=UPI00209C0FDB|nr:ArsB/NhaD family transporter [Anaerofustis sp. NSJ-163]MCO8193229.1 ArsB/NhaD family transporter [Anaerofustis sp. NSJ-163]